MKVWAWRRNPRLQNRLRKRWSTIPCQRKRFSRFRNSAGSHHLPAFGPSLYLVSELTSENQSPSAEFNYQQDKKAGASETSSYFLIISILALPCYAQQMLEAPRPLPGNVTLSLDEYNRLLALPAALEKRQTSARPLRFEAWRSKFHVVNDDVIGTIQFDGETLEAARY